MENHFFLKGKTMKQISNNFTILNRDYNTQRYNIKLCISHNFSYSLCFSLLFYFLSLTQFFKTIMSSLSQGLLTSPNGQMTFLLWIILYLWEPKMCRLTWQLLGMLGNVLAVLGMLCNVLSMLATFSASSACFFARSQEFHIEENPPHLLPYKL